MVFFVKKGCTRANCAILTELVLPNMASGNQSTTIKTCCIPPISSINQATNFIINSGEVWRLKVVLECFFPIIIIWRRGFFQLMMNASGCEIKVTVRQCQHVWQTCRTQWRNHSWRPPWFRYEVISRGTGQSLAVPRSPIPKSNSAMLMTRLFHFRRSV